MLNDPPKMVHRSTLAFTVLHAVMILNVYLPFQMIKRPKYGILKREN